MTLHLIKLAVGTESVSDLAAWQSDRLKEKKRAKQKPELMHVTRHMPKRSEDVLQDGSLYWVIKGWISVRQKLLELRPVVRDGVPHCALIYDQEIFAVEPRQCRAFQGWRYLEAKDAPRDLAKDNAGAELPEALRRELIALGLL